MFMDRDGIEAINMQKKEPISIINIQYSAILTEKAWSIKDLLLGFRGNFSHTTLRVVPSGQDSSILPAQVANHSVRNGLSCPLMELAL